jgi:hypothetical protein
MRREENDKLCQRLRGLTGRSSALLDKLASSDVPEADAVIVGQALTAVQSQIAVIVEARRAWIASHEMSTAMSKRLGLNDLLVFTGKAFPERLPEVEVPPGQEGLTASGCLVARLEPKALRRGRPQAVGDDVLILRKPRKIRLGVYLRKGQDEAGKPFWDLDADSVRFADVVDCYSDEEELKAGVYATPRAVNHSTGTVEDEGSDLTMFFASMRCSRDGPNKMHRHTSNGMACQAIGTAPGSEENEYQRTVRLTHEGDSQDGRGVIHHGKQARVFHGGGDRASMRLHWR